MSNNPFLRLAPFIQEYIYRHGWEELRPVQVEACRVLFESDAHLLLASGTASGKTEAAFLPILTLLTEKPSTSVGVLYVGPTKALINDQFFRLEGLLTESHIPVWHWHGDVSASHKSKLLKHPQGILQITPESLESMLINRVSELGRLFGDLRFVVIDEVHIFMGSDRGRQILCQLKRLEKFMAVRPRRVGLSATLGDYTLAEAWLQADTSRPVQTANPQAGRKLRLALTHYWEAAADSPDDAATENTTVANVSDDPYYQFVYTQSLERQKCLIFANSRQDTEDIIANLRQIAQRHQQPDIFHVHHGSIGPTLREGAEEAMRDPDVQAVTAATVTLELGIDLGQLERVIQLGAPFSVSSFLQRLGRSGRRGSPAEMYLVDREQIPPARAPLPRQIPWSLLQSIAIMQLYLQEKWIEPIPLPRYPFSLLYHQTMSILAGSGELSPARLAQQVLTLPPFQHVSQEDFRTLLRHLLETDHLQQTETKGLIIGLAGEKVVRNFRFYAVFADNEEFTVRHKAKEIGTIVIPPPPGERFRLAGRTWEVLEVDAKRRLVFVERVSGKVSSVWSGAGGEIHTKIVQRMKQVLIGNDSYSYLQPEAQERLAAARHLALQSGLHETNIVDAGGDSFFLFPWMGTVAHRTLDRYLKKLKQEGSLIRSVANHTAFDSHIRGPKTVDELRAILQDLLEQADLTEADLVTEGEAPPFQKYDEHLPPTLLAKAFVGDHLNLGEVREHIRAW